jgi:hypothetical protein
LISSIRRTKAGGKGSCKPRKDGSHDEDKKTNQEIIIEKENAKAEAHEVKMKPLLEELRAWGKETTACHGVTEAFLEKSKASLNKMENMDFDRQK